MKKENVVLILAGPSGGGKTAIASAILDSDSRFSLIRSGTTRAPRGDGFDAEYLYYSKDEFLSLIENGEVAEHMTYGGFMYGTPKSELRRVIDMGKIPLLVLDLNGVRSFAGLRDFSACSLYMYASLDTVETRLYDRYLKDNPDIKKLTTFVSRKEQNIDDYLSISDSAPYIYSFLENSGSIEACRDNALEIFASFCDGIPSDVTAKEKAVNILTRDGRMKKHV